MLSKWQELVTESNWHPEESGNSVLQLSNPQTNVHEVPLSILPVLWDGQSKDAQSVNKNMKGDVISH